MKPFSSLVPGTTSTLMPAAPAQQRVLDADKYDTLELVAESVGGIGGCIWFCHGDPVCGVGCADFGGIMAFFEPAKDHGLPHEGESDRAVRAINKRLGVMDSNARVPFALWAQELGLVRGPQPEPSPDATWDA